MSDANPKQKKSAVAIAFGILLIILGVIGGLNELMRTPEPQPRNPLMDRALEEAGRPGHNIAITITMIVLIVAGLWLTGVMRRIFPKK